MALKYMNFLGIATAMAPIFVTMTEFQSRAAEGGFNGGGGGAYICSDAHGNITSAHLVDLWEADNGRFPTDRSRKFDPIDQQLADAFARLKRINPHLGILAEAKWAWINDGRKVSVLDDAELPKPKDVNEDLGKRNCPLSGMMHFNDSFQVLRIKQPVFDKLPDNTEKAAAYFHETIYKVLREIAPQSDSTKARLLTSCIFSRNPEACFEAPLRRDYKIPKDREAWRCNVGQSTFLAIRNKVGDAVCYESWEFVLERANGIELTVLITALLGFSDASADAMYLGHMSFNRRRKGVGSDKKDIYSYWLPLRTSSGALKQWLGFRDWVWFRPGDYTGCRAGKNPPTAGMDPLYNSYSPIPCARINLK